MPSANKTPNIGLNQWKGNEYAKRQDFNDDNLIVDIEIKKLAKSIQEVEVPVTSVNTKTGAVVLTANDVGAETPSGAQAKANAAASSANNYTDQETEETRGLIGAIANLATSIKTNIVAAINELFNDLKTHKENYTLQVPYAVATGSVNDYAISTPITSLVDGIAVSVKINVDSTGASTLNWNNKGAKGIKKANGTDATNLKANGIYTLRYDGVNFILQGEGASGNATASDLLSGKTASTDAGDIVGTILSKSAQTYTPRTTAQTIALGQFLSGTQTIAGDSNLVASNILSGKSIFGVAGNVINGAGMKKYATGSYTHKGTSTILTASGLGFRPGIVFVYTDIFGNNYMRVAIGVSGINGISRNHAIEYGLSGSTPESMFNRSSNFSPTSSGFSIHVTLGSSLDTVTMYWVAIE